MKDAFTIHIQEISTLFVPCVLYCIRVSKIQNLSHIEKRTSPRLHQAKKAKQRSSDSCSLERCNKNGILSPPKRVRIDDCRNMNYQQNIQLSEPIYVAKLIYHPSVKECSSYFFPSSDSFSHCSFESTYSAESNSDVNRTCSFDNSRE